MCKVYVTPILHIELATVEDAGTDMLVYALSLRKSVDDGVQPLYLWAASLEEAVPKLPSVAFVFHVSGGVGLRLASLEEAVPKLPSVAFVFFSVRGRGGGGGIFHVRGEGGVCATAAPALPLPLCPC